MRAAVFKSSSVPVLRGIFCDVCGVSDPLELQRPAALGQTGEHESVALQVCLCTSSLCFEVRGDVCGEITKRIRSNAL